MWAAIMEGNRAALEYLQDEAGMTRTGYHRGSGTESGAELGKWEHARNWVVGSFRQCDDLFSRCDLVASWSRTGTPLSRPIFNPSSGGQAQLVDAVVSYAPGA